MSPHCDDIKLPRIDRICIIGAGPSGLAAAKYLRDEQKFSHITILEQSGTVGGIWNYVPCQTTDPPDLTIPQTSADSDPAQPIWNVHEQLGSCENLDGRPAVLTPLYDRLETNIPRDLMKFTDQEWPSNNQLFPQHELVLDYIKRYAHDVHDLIRFRCQVLDVSPVGTHEWTIKSQELTPTGPRSLTEETYDAVIVANGHFNVPYIPDVPGIKDWTKEYPGTILHSRYYRNPESDSYAGKKVIVVGSSASGADIGAQIQETCKPPLIVSQRAKADPCTSDLARRKVMPPIAEFMPGERTIRFVDGSIEADIDCIVYCTGYVYSYPFLRSLHPSVITTGERVENTYQHIFYRPRPTLAFVMLNQKVIPFPLAEAQSALIARVFSQRLSLPGKMRMKAWEDTLLTERNGRQFHVLNFPADALYINMLHDWASRAIDEDIIHNRERRRPPYWNSDAQWIREHVPDMKKAFQDLKDRRHDARTIEDIGFYHKGVDKLLPYCVFCQQRTGHEAREHLEEQIRNEPVQDRDSSPTHLGLAGVKS